MGQICSQCFQPKKKAESHEGEELMRDIVEQSFNQHEDCVKRGSSSFQRVESSSSIEIMSSKPLMTTSTSHILIDYLNESECVMCLDTFDPTNPKVRTLCNCGMNRTNFHLSCLHEWIQRSSLCPVCRQTLFYEEDQAADDEDY